MSLLTCNHEKVEDKVSEVLMNNTQWQTTWWSCGYSRSKGKSLNYSLAQDRTCLLI